MLSWHWDIWQWYCCCHNIGPTLIIDWNSELFINFLVLHLVTINNGYSWSRTVLFFDRFEILILQDDRKWNIAGMCFCQWLGNVVTHGQCPNVFWQMSRDWQWYYFSFFYKHSNTYLVVIRSRQCVKTYHTLHKETESAIKVKPRHTNYMIS